jgi:MoxR-like ATPase
MPDAADYLDAQFKRDLAELETAYGLIDEVISTLERFASAKGWPYELKEDASGRPELGKSMSTQAMVLFAIASAAGRVPATSPLLPSLPGRRKLVTIEPEAWRKFQGPSVTLFDAVKGHADELRFGEQSHISWSSSFGWDDPFTLAWLLELLHCKDLTEQVAPELRLALRRRAEARVVEAFASAKGQPDRKEGPFLTWRLSPDLKLSDERLAELKGEKTRDNVSALDHAFPLLRFVQLKRALGADFRDVDEQVPSVAGAMLERVHEHLSRVEIRDGSFDAAEMVFALEAALLLRPSGVTRPLLLRVFDVLAREQKNNPYWRPVKPFVIRPQGHVLFPVSVETASSLLRCCALAEALYPDEQWFSQNVVLFSQYLDWLRGRERRGRCLPLEGNEKCEFMGWHSEHVHLHQGIHLWETSQVLLFLSFYSAMLERHVARRALASANLTAKPQRIGRASTAVERWEKNRIVGEPLLGLPPDSRHRILDRYFLHYLVEPRSAPTDGEAAPPLAPGAPHYSVLLYGPPGTAKTTIAEDLCSALGWPLITITPSDFIHGGEGQIEARAKRIFDVLEVQSDVVVLFDEIDRLILDRDATAYLQQGDLFQFMTPSMLPKLRDLRKRRGPVFIIATNYEERIDAAIKRRGRIDEVCLVAPPDVSQRKRILRALVRDRLGLGPNEQLAADAEEALTRAAVATRLMVYGEMEQLVDASVERAVHEGHREAASVVAFVEEDAGKSVRAITLRGYRSRFEAKEWEQRPYREFFVLVYLRLEEGGVLDGDERAIADLALERLVSAKPRPDRKKASSAFRELFGPGSIADTLVDRLYPVARRRVNQATATRERKKRQ